MSDSVKGLLGFALVAGLFVLYWRERRQRRRAAAGEPGSVPPLAPALPATPAPAQGEEAVGPSPPHRSPNFGFPILMCFLLFLTAGHRHDGWGYLWQGLYLAVVAVAVYSTLSPKEFERDHGQHPERTRRVHIVVMAVPYVLFPAAGWVMVVVVGWNAGVLVPALPWVPLVLGAMLAGPLEGLQRRRGWSFIKHR